MALVRQDEFGLYTTVGGYIARPVYPTRYKAGDQPKTHHFTGSIKAGVGQDSTCSRGEYLEVWTTTGMTYSDLKKTPQSQVAKDLSWYLCEFKSLYQHVYRPKEE